MNSAFRISPRLVDSFDDRIDILFRELELAIKWQRPSLLFAVYDSDSARIEAENLLRTRLTCLGQRVIPLRVNDQTNSNIAQAIAATCGYDKSIFFVSGLDMGGKKCEPNSYTTLNIHREFFVENQILIIFWLTENEAINLAHDAPDFWVFRHRVIEFIDIPIPEKVTSVPGKPVAQPIGNPQNAALSTGHVKSEDSASTNANILLKLGVLNWRRGNLEKAASLMEAALGASSILNDKWFEAKCFNAIALVKTDQGKLEEAIKAYQQAMCLAPDQIFSWNNMGNLYNKLNRSNEAIDAFQRAIGHNPKDAVSWNGLGNVLSILGQTNKAIFAYQRAIMCAPTFVNPVIGLADAYVSSGRINTAVVVYKKAIELNDHLVDPLLKLGMINIDQGNQVEAINTFKKVVSLDPTLACAWNELGKLFLSSNSYDDAITSCKKAIALDRSLGSAYINLAQAYYFTRKYSQCITVYQKALEQLKADKERAAAWVGLGDAYWQINDFSHAMAAYGCAKQFNGPKSASRPEPVDQKVLISEKQCEDLCKNSSPLFDIDETLEKTVAMPRETNIEVPTLAENNQPVVDLKESNKESPAMNQKEFSGDEKAELLPVNNEELPANDYEAITSPSNAADWNDLGHHFLQIHSYDKAIEAYTRAIELSSEYHWPYIKNLTLAHYKKGKSKVDPNSVVEPAENELIDHTRSIRDGGVETMTQDVVTRPEVAAEGLIRPVSLDQAGGMAEHEIRLEDFSMGAGAFDEDVLESPIKASRPAKSENEEWHLETILEPSQSFIYQSGLLPETTDGATVVSLPANEEVRPEDSAQYALEWSKLGDLYLKVGSYAEAIEAYQKAVKLNPKCAEAIGNMALAHYHKGNYVESISLYQKSIELSKGSKEKAIIWNRLGDAYRRLNNEKSAMAAYQKAARLDSVANPLLTRARMALLGNVRG
jgi:tetratricopeptide (TPR) repeat protein